MKKTLSIILAGLFSISSQATVITTEIQATLQINDACSFTQSNFNTNINTTVGNIGKSSAGITLICSNNLSYSIGMLSTSPYISNGEVPAIGTGENLRVIGYVDSAYTKNLATNRISSMGDGTIQNQTIYFKLVNRDSQDEKIKKGGSFTAIYPIEIYY